LSLGIGCTQCPEQPKLRFRRGLLPPPGALAEEQEPVAVPLADVMIGGPEGGFQIGILGDLLRRPG